MTDDEHDRHRDWDASYVLGALTAHERLEYERHLATCAACRAAVAELAGMPGLLGRLTADEAVAIADGPSAGSGPAARSGPAPEAGAPAGRAGAGRADTVRPEDGAGSAPDTARSAVGAGAAPGAPDRVVVTPDALAHVARRVRIRRRRRRVLVGVTAGLAVVVAVLGGIAVGATGTRSVDAGPAPSSAPSSRQPSAPERYVMSPVEASALRVDLDVRGRPWGTRFDWGCSYGGHDWGSGDSVMYDLVVTRSDGAESTVATWSASGRDASGLAAATDIPRGSIRSVEVRLHGDTRTLARAAL